MTKKCWKLSENNVETLTKIGKKFRKSIIDHLKTAKIMKKYIENIDNCDKMYQNKMT